MTFYVLKIVLPRSRWQSWGRLKYLFDSWAGAVSLPRVSLDYAEDIGIREQIVFQLQPTAVSQFAGQGLHPALA